MFSDSDENEALGTLIEAVQRGWTVTLSPHYSGDGDKPMVALTIHRETKYAIACVPERTPVAKSISNIWGVFRKAREKCGCKNLDPNTLGCLDCGSTRMDRWKPTEATT